jgi:hypothetical protein
VHGTHAEHSTDPARPPDTAGHGIIERVSSSPSGAIDAVAAVRNAHDWFEVNSGWAPPDEDTLAEWLADGVCRCPDECLVGPDEWCEHGLASWALVLAALDEAG